MIVEMSAGLETPRKRRFSTISISSEPSSDPYAEKLYCHLMTSNYELFTTGKYSDFTVFCGNREFRLHRSIVCPRSSFFASALDSNFVVSLPCIL